MAEPPLVTDELRALAIAQGGVFTRKQAITHGLTDEKLDRLLAVGALTRVRAGVYTELDSVREPRAYAVARICAASLRSRRGTFSHESAALLHGVNLRRVPEHVHVTATTGKPARHSDLVVHVAALPDDQVASALVHGRRLTAGARSLVDTARHLSFSDAVVALDDALRRGLCSERELQEILEFCATWPGIAGARRAVDFADGRAESALESLSRVFFLEEDIEQPEIQVWLSLPTRQVRVDFYWRRRRVVGEADGRKKYEQPADLWEEKRRQEDIENDGNVVVRWGWDDLVVRRKPTRVRILSAFARAERLAG